MHTEGNDKDKPKSVHGSPQPKHDAEHPGYEVEDVNVGGVVTFLAGLSGFITIFIVFCFFMGKAINYGLSKQDGQANKWHQGQGTLGETPRGEKLQHMTSSAVMEQRQLAQMTKSFPTPQLETDDGNQDIADLHSREDLLLDFYSTSKDLPAGTVRIPIARAMQLIVQRGLPAPAQAMPQQTLMAGETPMVIQAPLTDGFARTGYEQDVIQEREQRLEFESAEAASLARR